MRRLSTGLSIILVVAAFLTVYVGAYVVLSRRGYAEAQRYGLKGFYYVPYEPTPRCERMHAACVVVFMPLNAIDRILGTGRPPGAPPTNNLR
jgi:hypothetical protein